MVQKMTSPRRWIFLRGLARHSGHWGPFLDHFKKTFPQDEIELLDLRGNGILAHSPSWLSIPDNVRDLRSRSQFVQAGHPVNLLTISLGSMIGVEWARLFPEEVESLVTINTSDKGTSRLYERMQPHNLKTLVHILGNTKTNPFIEKEIMHMTTTAEPEGGEGEWAKAFGTIMATSRTNFFRQLIAASRYRFPQQKPKTDILMLCSDGDRLVNPVCSKRIAQMWTLNPHVHPTSGHDIPLQEPQWVCDEIKHWIES